MLKISDMKQKEVINIRDGCRFGYLCDMEMNEEGELKSIIVPCPGKVFGMFGVEKEYHIPWDDISKIGEDIILVDVDVEKIIVKCD
ncbi:MAG: YlmC/YmxH family sporulation protein [Clostridiales bacterium]|jgi:YlmC/YmxH family sporulation protein|nr:YlmC/YmxH family sporulation protein [Clostridiales bacterium]